MKGYIRVFLLFVKILFLLLFLSVFWISINEIRSGRKDDPVTAEDYHDFHDYRYEEDTILSEFRSKEYHCYGYCYCEEDEFRRGISTSEGISFSRGVSALVFAVSLVTAFRLAKDRFEVDCQTMLEDECLSYNSIHYEIDECESELEASGVMDQSNDDSRLGDIPEECYIDPLGEVDHPFDPKTQYKLISWNINGINAFSQKIVEGSENTWAEELVNREQPTMILLQEIKLSSEKQIEKFKNVFPGYTGFFYISKNKKGYSGTAIFVRDDQKDELLVKGDPSFGIDVEKHDGEGRTITAELPEFYLVNNYVPNSGDGFKRLDYRIEEWDVDLQNYLLGLKKKKNIVWAGDLNTAILDIDVHNPKTQKSAGFHPRERKSFGEFLEDNQLVDTFRYYHPDKQHCYSYWGYRFKLREKNKGWRLDYFVVSSGLQDKLVDSYILPEYKGSDHCPVGLIINRD